MENLVIDKKKGIPEIKFNAQTGEMFISGQSFPEDTLEFYSPVILWLQNFLETEKKKISFNIDLQYFNTSSSKAILDMLSMLDNHFNNGNEVEINWFYNEDDDDIYDIGVQFTEEMKAPCNILAIKK